MHPGLWCYHYNCSNLVRTTYFFSFIITHVCKSLRHFLCMYLWPHPIAFNFWLQKSNLSQEFQIESIFPYVCLFTIFPNVHYKLLHLENIIWSLLCKSSVTNSLRFFYLTCVDFLHDSVLYFSGCRILGSISLSAFADRYIPCVCGLDEKAMVFLLFLSFM